MDGKEYQVITELRNAGLTVATAESCTGGLVAKLLTDVPGASWAFKGGVVSYTNYVKNHVLNVPQELLDEYGAVSEPVAKAMADGVRKITDADIAVSVTGVAGPDRDDRGNEVGTVYIGFSSKKGTEANKYMLGSQREEIRNNAAQVMFDQIINYTKLRETENG